MNEDDVGVSGCGRAHPLRRGLGGGAAHIIVVAVVGWCVGEYTTT
jgi:hypothetical protein